MRVTEADGIWEETRDTDGTLLSRQLITPSAAWIDRRAAACRSSAPLVRPTSETSNVIDWAKDKKAKDDADSSDSTVTSLKDDVQALKTAVKAMAAGNVTLTKAQVLVIVRGLLYTLKGDKTS